ncbi:hypothetical protein RE628_06030 [Paenibacillus sp. D2_2]|uniref:hypothetical protein n=1 Tax=Paenibacillus sp. D2_2 TaxID=3073092 RepID=UPI0028165458|nr:hypothetical protein [Paenibacillus sp. D2_2]WMT41996.1 hypothetical protein RE628_06030 [Paenibacillus sp. D2_2]
MYINSYYKHEHIKGAVIVLFDNKPGIGATFQQIRTTDEEEIAAVVRLLKDRTVIKTFPDIGPVRSYTSHFYELWIQLITDNNRTLEYKINSFGHVEVRKGIDKTSNTLIFGGSSKKWFNEIKALFEEKQQNPLWSS